MESILSLEDRTASTQDEIEPPKMSSSTLELQHFLPHSTSEPLNQQAPVARSVPHDISNISSADSGNWIQELQSSANPEPLNLIRSTPVGASGAPNEEYRIGLPTPEISQTDHEQIVISPESVRFENFVRQKHKFADLCDYFRLCGNTTVSVIAHFSDEI